MNRWLIFAAFMFVAGNLIAGVIDTQAVIATTQLDGPITASSADIPVYSTDNFYDPDTYTIGSATFTLNSAAVVGTNTAWTRSLEGRLIKLNADSAWAKIAKVTDATHITLTSGYAGAGGSGAYTILLPGYIVIGNELVSYSAKDADSFTVLQRGAADPRGTLAQVDAKAWPDKTKVMSLTARTVFGLGALNLAVGGASFGTMSSYVLTLGPLKDLYKMLAWDYPWFTGTWIIARLLLLPFSFAILWGIALLTLQLLQGIFRLGG
jgi:hypothetical protein